MNECITCWDTDGEEHPPVNCPNCGRFLKWNGWDKGFSCVCNGIINIWGSGDPEIDDSDMAIRVCKISHIQDSEGTE